MLVGPGGAILDLEPAPDVLPTPCGGQAGSLYDRNSTLKRGLFGWLAAIWLLSGSAAADITLESRTPFAHGLSHGGSDLVLRSASLKEATILKVDVYWVGLYLETADTPPDSIIESVQVKAFVFHFLRDVKSEKLGEAWIHDLTAACESNCRSVIAQGRILARSMPDVYASQKIAYVLFADRVDVLIDGEFLGTLIGENAPRAILATFLGPQAPSDMRDDLFGTLIPRERQ